MELPKRKKGRYIGIGAVLLSFAVIIASFLIMLNSYNARTHNSINRISEINRLMELDTTLVTG